MDSKQIIREWIGSTKDAIIVLQVWKAHLEDWERNGGELWPGEFSAAFNDLYRAGLGDGWADGNKAGGGLDALAEAVTGREP